MNRYHINLYDLDTVRIENVRIHVDTEAQLGLHSLLASQYAYNSELKRGLGSDIHKSSGKHTEVPLYPLNTDGIDPRASNVIIRNLTVTNFDDAIAIKPCDSRGLYCQCASNIVIRDVRTTYSVGISVGAVSPNRYHACIKNVSVADVIMRRPYKGIYVKTNPNADGDPRSSGVVQNISYTNIYMRHPLWWPIWVGPQQQHQPGDKGDQGCAFSFPIENRCEVTVAVAVWCDGRADVMGEEEEIVR